jgi:hypothetical protein
MKMKSDVRYSRPLRYAGLLLALLAFAGCVVMPEGPSHMSLPGTGKSFDQFRADDTSCRQYASSTVGGSTPEQTAADSTARSAVAGTAIGAASGALIGGSGAGAAVGAGVGLLGGALVGSSTGYASSYSLQNRYDASYTQCMYAKGHKVPVYGNYTSSNERGRSTTYSSPPPPPTTSAPPPPPPAPAR